MKKTEGERGGSQLYPGSNRTRAATACFTGCRGTR